MHVNPQIESQVNSFDEAERQKIRDMASKDIPIEERRTLYNALGRRMANPVGLPPGLVEKYTACAGCNQKRFELLKEFMLDADMPLNCNYLLTIIHGVFDQNPFDVPRSSQTHSTLNLNACNQSTCVRKEVEVEAYFVQLQPEIR